MSPTPAQLAPSAAATNGSGAAPPKKSKKKLILILVLVILLAGGYEAKSILLKPHYLPGQRVPLGKIVPLDQLTVNLADGHLVQLSASLQLTKVASAAKVTADLPRLESVAITDLGAFTYQGLLAPKGRAQLKSELLSAYQKITGTVDGSAQQVADVYFTSFVIQ